MSELVNVQPAPAGGFFLRRYLAQAEAETPLGRALAFLAISLQFAVVLFLVQRFNLEDERFLLVVRAAFAGFLVHHFLPLRWRLPFFVTLSLGTVAYFLGLRQGVFHPDQALVRTALLVGIGLVFIGICHLPFRFWTRAGLLGLAGGVLAVFRLGWINVSPLNAIWPILGAMFMFRLIAYIYDREHEKEHASFWHVLSYFFLFPTIWIFVFPIIDYKNFRRGYFNDRPAAIYQKGLQWMMRGVIQLLIWRLFYYHVYLDPAHIASGADVVQFLVANVALYLRVSGQFHFVIGLLHLFGFNLPESNRRYFLASSFTDYWRRAAIYWKDFMLKVFYYPAVVRLKSWGTTGSIVGAIAFAFVLTWLLHSYQWFWLRGGFPIQPKDIVFWGLLGALVCATSVYELKHGRTRSLGRQVYSWKNALGLALRTAGTFTVITVLWSIWSSDSLTQWAGIWTHADWATLTWGIGVLAVIGAAAVAFESPASPFKASEENTRNAAALQWQRIASNVAIAFVLCLVTNSRITRFFSYQTDLVLQSLFKNTPNKSDEEFMVRGYYENLTDTSRFNPAMSSAIALQPSDWMKLEDTDAVRDVYDLRTKELVPSKKFLLNGTRFQTNSFGLRDQEYSKVKPQGAYRIALLGSSQAMGSGVSNDEVFEAVLEERLNREHKSAPRERYEILNFAVNAFSPLSLVDVIDKKVLEFRPDAVFFIAHRQDPSRSGRMLAKSIRMGVNIQDPVLRSIITKAGISPSTSREQAEVLLIPHWGELVQWAYQRVAGNCRQAGILPLWIFVPPVPQANRAEDERIDTYDQLIHLAKEAGFVTVSLLDAFGKTDPMTLVVAPWDGHPNAKGHRMIADSLYEALRTTEGLGVGLAEHLRAQTGGGMRK